MVSKKIQLDKPKLGIALGSGGAKGLAHIGILKVLEENDIPVSFIAGSSMGALIGAFYSFFKSSEKLAEIAGKTNWTKILSLLIDPALEGGFVKGDKIEDYIENYIGEANFADLKIPLSIVATDLGTGKHVILKKGKVSSAVRASISIPLIFRPVKINDRLLVDGGLSFPVPVGIARDMGAEVVLAVDLYHDYKPDFDRRISFSQVGQDSINIVLHHLAAHNVERADIVIFPEVGKIRWNDFLKYKEIISIGEKAALAALSQIKEKLGLEKK